MPKTVLFVVGDHLTGGPPHAGMISLSGLIAELETGRLREPLPLLVPGQGLDEHGCERIRAKLRRCGLPESALSDPSTPEALSCSDTHKRLPENVVIAGMRRIANTRYEAALRISDQQEMVLDHATGSHITGMVIMEAVRQMCLAVTERHLLPPDSPAHRFLINSVETTFRRFLFPLPTTIDCRIEELARKGPAQLHFRCHCDFVQAGVTVASGAMQIAVMEEARAIDLEARQSVDVLRGVAREILGDAVEDLPVADRRLAS